MFNKLQSLLFTIDDAIEVGNVARAAQLLLANWHHLPDNAPLRERAATLLASLGHSREAIEIYERIAIHYAHAGFPTRSLAALKQMQALQPDRTGALDRFAELYNIRSPYLSSHRSQPDVALPTAPLQLETADMPDDEQQLLAQLVERAFDPASLAAEPADELPALSLLSLLPAETLRRVLDFLDYEIFAHAQPVISPDYRTSELAWTASSDMTLPHAEKGMRLPAGTLLGLNAFGQAAAPPRHTVMSQRGSELLRLSHTSIARLCEEFPDFLNRLTTLRRHALTEGLLCRHELFSTLDPQERIELAANFIGLRIAQGEQLLYQAEPGPGLFVILDGTIEITRNHTADAPIATLSAGDILGEISLVTNQPASANAIMSTPGHVLFLAREDFNRALERHPTLASYTNSLAMKRQIASNKDALQEGRNENSV